MLSIIVIFRAYFIIINQIFYLIIKKKTNLKGKKEYLMFKKKYLFIQGTESFFNNISFIFYFKCFGQLYFSSVSSHYSLLN